MVINAILGSSSWVPVTPIMHLSISIPTTPLTGRGGDLLGVVSTDVVKSVTTVLWSISYTGYSISVSHLRYFYGPQFIPSHPHHTYTTLHSSRREGEGGRKRKATLYS